MNMFVRCVLFFFTLLQAREHVYAQCGVTISADKSQVCVPGIVKLKVTGCLTCSGIDWDLGNGFVPGKDTFSVLVGKPGTYSVTVRLRLSGGGTCTQVRQNLFVGVATPQPKLQASAKAQCFGNDSIEFKDVTPGSLKRDWFLDGKTFRNAARSIKVRFSPPAGYKGVFMIVTDSNGCTGSRFIDSAVGVFDSVKASFQADVVKGCVPRAVQFSYKIDSLGIPLDYLSWNFGAKGPPTYKGRAFPKVTYTQADTHKVSLTVVTRAGCRYEFPDSNYLNFGDPSALTVNSGIQTLCINGIANISVNGNTQYPISWAWTPSATQTDSTSRFFRSFRFQDTGFFALTLRQVHLGCVSQRTFPKLVQVQGPKVVIGIKTPSYCSIPDTLEALNRTAEPKGFTTTWRWTVTDEFGMPVTTSTQKDLVWYPDKQSDFDVKLVAQSTNGCRDSLTMQKAVLSDSIYVPVLVIPSTVCPGQMVNILPDENDIRNRNGYTYKWQITNRKGTVLGTSSGKTTNFSSNDTGKFTVRMIVFDGKSCYDTLLLKDTIKVYYPRTTLRIADSIVCRNNQAVFYAKQVNGSPTARHWWDVYNLDSGGYRVASGKDSAKLLMLTNGRHRMQYSYSDTAMGGCSFKMWYPGNLFVNGPVISITAEPFEDCAPLRTWLRGKILADPDYEKNNVKPTHSWSGYLPRQSLIDSPLLLSTRAVVYKGKQFFNLRYRGKSGCLDSSIYITAYGGISSGFALGGSTRCPRDTYQVINYSSKVATHFKWVGAHQGVKILPTDTSRTPRFIFPKAGNYLMSLIVFKASECSDTFNLPIQIDSIKAVFFTQDTVAYCAPKMVELNNTSWMAAKSYWTFGNDPSITISLNNKAAQKVFNFNNPTGIDVKLVAESKYGCRDSLTRFKYIKVIGPVANLQLEQNKGCEPLTVYFRNNSTSYSRYYMDYGNGIVKDSTGLGTHTYLVGNKSLPYQAYYPSIALVDSLGCFVYAKSRDSVVVISGAEASFTVEDQQLCIPELARFTNKSMFWKQLYWDFESDGVVDLTLPDPQWQYTPGMWKPTLIAENDNGCRDTFTWPQPITVFPSPVVNIGISGDSVCFGDPIHFTALVQGKTGIQRRQWDFGDETSLMDFSNKERASWTYKTPFQKTVSLTIMDSNLCFVQASRSVFVKDTVPPENPELKFVTVAPDNKSVYVSWNPYQKKDFEKYLLHQDSAAYFLKRTFSNFRDTTYSYIHGNSLAAQSVCYAIQVADSCGMRSGFGVSHCTILAEVELPPGMPYALELKWTPYKGWQEVQYYEVFRSKDGSTFTPYRQVKPWQLNLLDTLLCSHDYCYYVVAHHKNGWTSRSNTTCGKPLYDVPRNLIPMQLVSVVNSAFASVAWEHAPDYYSGITYLVGKAQGSGWNEVGRTKTNRFSDFTAKVNRNAETYAISYMDHCGGASGWGIPGTTIFAAGKMNGDIASIEWTPYKEWPEGIKEYQVQRLDQQGVFKTMISLSPQTLNWNDPNALSISNDTLRYRVLALRASGRIDTSVSNHVYLVPASRLFAPNAFTPNGDGQNDVFTARSLYIVKEQFDPARQFEMRIFNRWGGKVFETNNPDAAWDGTYEGRSCAQGVYAFQIKGVGYDGKLFVINGNLSLLR
jgi:gliding motility-associated-like protein